MIEKENLFYKDIMSQNFSVGTFYNPTRYLLLYAILDDGIIQKEYNKYDIAKYIFAAYCSNHEIAKHHPNLEIRKIPFYGIQSIYDDLEIALKEWVLDAPNNILSYDFKKIYIDLEDDGHIAEYVKKILSVLFFKTFNQKFLGITTLSKEVVLNDLDLNYFGKSYYRNLVFADMQYCVLCDECKESDLYAVHILNSSKTENLNYLLDPNNGLLMCKEHAEMYNNNKFSFDERGKVVGNDNLHNVRISNRIFVRRKFYFEKLNNVNNEN